VNMGITGMVTTVTDVLNIWNDLGVFSYAIPFLLIFAVVFAILEKSKVLSSLDRENSIIEAIVSAAIGLLSLQFDFVSEFFAIIFPRFGVGLSIFLVLLIILGLFHKDDGDKGVINKPLAAISWLVGVGVVIWALSAWDEWGNIGGFGGWFSEYLWALIVLGIIIAVIVVFATTTNSGSNTPGKVR
jgi:hypothetical protein